MFEETCTFQKLSIHGRCVHGTSPILAKKKLHSISMRNWKVSTAWFTIQEMLMELYQLRELFNGSTLSTELYWKNGECTR
jgi:hypothetical protein